MLQYYRDACIDKRRVNKWVDVLKNGWTSIWDEQCSGHPSMAVMLIALFMEIFLYNSDQNVRIGSTHTIVTAVHKFFLSCMHCWGLGFWLMSTKYIVESSAAFWAWCYNYEGEDFLACIIVVLKQEAVFRMAALIFKKGSSATLHWFGPVHSLLAYELTNFGSISEKG